MMLTHLLTKKVVIGRRVVISGNKMVFSTVTTEIINIQPSSDSSSEISEGVFGKSFKLYLDGGANLRAGDRLRDEDNNYYTVVPDGVSRRTMGSMDYIIAVVQKTKH